MIYPKEWKQKRVENGHMVQRMLGFGGMVLALAGILLAGLNLYANETSLGNITLTGTSASETVTLSESGTQVIMAGDVVCDSSLIDIDIDIDSVTHYAFVEVEDDSNTPDNSAETTVALSDIGTNKTLELPGTEGAYTLYLGDSKSDDSYLGEYSVYVIAEMEAPTLTVTYQESGTFGRMTTSGTTMLVAGDKIDQPSDTSTYTYEYAFTTMNSVPSSSADVPTTGISVANTSNTYLYIEQTFTDTTDEDITRSEGYFYPIEVRSVPTQTLTDVDAKDLTTYASSNTTLNYILADSELTSTIGGGTTGDTFQYEWSGDESTAPTSWKSSSITADMTTITTTGVTDTSYLHIQVVTPAISNGGYLNQRTLLSEVFCIEEVTVSEPTVTLTHTSFSTTEDGTLNGTVTLEQNSETLYGAGDTFTITDSETNATVAYLLSESEIVEDNAVFANVPSAVSIETGMTHLHIRTTISGISKDFTYPLTEIILEEATVTYNEVDINADSTTSINTSYTPNPSVTISTQESSSNGFRYQVSSGNSSSTLARGTTGEAIPITPTTGTTYLYIQDTQTIDSTTVYWPIKQYTFTFVENISQATLRDSSGEDLTSNSTLSNGGDILGFVSQTDSDGVVYLVGSADNTIGIASEVTSLDNLTGYTQVLGTTVVSHGGDYYLQDVDGYHKITSNQDLTTIQLYTDTDTGFVVGELIGNSVSISAITLGDNSTTANSGVAQYTLTIGAYTPDSPNQVTTSIFQTDSGSDTIILANDSTTAVIAGNTITIKDDDIYNTNAIGTKYTWSMSSDSSVDSTTLFYVDATSSGASATLTIPSYIGDYNLYLKKVKYNTTSGVAIAEELYTYPLGIQTLPVITLKNEDHLANLDSDGEMMTNGMNTVVAGETISFAQTGADALVSSTVSYRYAFTNTQVTSSDLLDGIVVESQEKMTVPVEASYLYVQIYDKTDGISKWLDPVEYKLQYMQQMSPVVLSIMTKSVNATGGDEVGMIQAVSYGTEITLQTVPSNSIILYMQSDTISLTNSFDIEEQEVTDGDLITRLESLNGTSGYKNLVGLEDVYYVKRGITWCQLQPTQGLELKEYDDGNLPTYLLNEGSTDKDIYIAFISGQSDAQPSEVVRYAVTATARSLVTTPTSVTGSDITATQYVQLAVLNQTTTYYTMGYDTDGITNISQLADPTTSSTVYDTATGILSWAGEIGDTVPSKLYVKAFSVDNTGTKLDSNVASFTYDIGGLGTVADPTAFPTTYTDSQTIVNPGQSIIIWSTTPDATIYYTTSEDNHKTTYTYSGGIEVPLSESGYFEVKAIAKKAGMNDSNQMTFSYQLPAAVSPPYVTPSAGSVELNTEVSLGTTTEGGSIYYEIAYGSTPVDPSTSSPIYDESQTFVITQDTTIKAMTVKDGVPSTVVTFNFTPMAQIELPTASITSGSTVARGTVITFHGADGATIYYTTDGSDPSEVGNSMVTTGTSFMIDGEAGEMVTVKLYAKLSGNSSSEIATYTYLISQYSGGVSSDVESGSKIPRSTIVNLTTDLLDATLYYTLDGSEPTTTSASGT
ncbi:MAG: FN3 associated domain-containing protein, partial [Eubacteriales bacterium]